VLAQVVDSGEVPGGGPHGDAGAGGDRAVGQRADAGLGDQLRRGASDVVDPLLGIAGASGARHVYSSRCCTNVRVQTYSNLREAEIVVVAWWGVYCRGAVGPAAVHIAVLATPQPYASPRRGPGGGRPARHRTAHRACIRGCAEHPRAVVPK